MEDTGTKKSGKTVLNFLPPDSKSSGYSDFDTLRHPITD